MIKIQVFQTAARDIKGISKTTQKPFAFRVQTAYANTLDRDGNAPPVPEKFEIVLDDGAAAYPTGVYTLHPSSLYVDRNGRLQVSARLVAVLPKAA